MYAFVFVDKTQADELLRGWLYSNMDDWNTMSHSAREWYQVKNGFFILLGNKDQTPFQAIVEYRGRTHIEAVFRDGKSYLKILPISKWTNETVTGKILHDIIEIIFYREYRKNVANAHLPMSKLIVQMSSWQCILEGNTVNTWPPKKQVREIMEAIGFNALSHYNLVDMRNEILNGIPMAREPIKPKRKRKIESQCIPISPEEKKEASENKKRDNEAKNQAKAAERQAAREAKAAEKQAAREAKAAERQTARKAKDAKQPEVS